MLTVSKKSIYYRWVYFLLKTLEMQFLKLTDDAYLLAIYSHPVMPTNLCLYVSCGTYLAPGILLGIVLLAVVRLTHFIMSRVFYGIGYVCLHAVEKILRVAKFPRVLNQKDSQQDNAPTKVSLVAEYIKAKKANVCPMIEFVD